MNEELDRNGAIVTLIGATISAIVMVSNPLLGTALFALTLLTGLVIFLVAIGGCPGNGNNPL